MKDDAEELDVDLALLLLDSSINSIEWYKMDGFTKKRHTTHQNLANFNYLFQYSVFPA